jgi:hypothetical protein
MSTRIITDSNGRKHITNEPLLHQPAPVALPCCGYTDAGAVKWNPFNGVVQCHNCGQTYTPPAQPAPVQEMTNIQRHEQNVQKFLAAQPAPVQEPDVFKALVVQELDRLMLVNAERKGML